MDPKKNKILIVEDDSYISDMYKIKLEEEGCSVHVAPDGENGLELADKVMPDIILLDVVMPKMDGFAVLQNLRGNEKFNNTPIVMLTNLGQKESVERGLKSGADDYIVKAHFTPSEVVSKIEDILNK
ncbi:MAG: response regulator [Candidatus Pacebacteria bacterium]|nr:response regulator [Candidatus Paceibacterota bacterium]